MRFIPMHLRTAQGTAGDTNHSHAFQFPPVPTPVRAVEKAPSVHPTPCGNGFNGSNLSNDLKIHDVSSSHSSVLQIHGAYASVMQCMSIKVAEHGTSDAAGSRRCTPFLGSAVLEMTLRQNLVDMRRSVVNESLNLADHPLENVSAVYGCIQELDVCLSVYAPCCTAPVLLSDVG